MQVLRSMAASNWARLAVALGTVAVIIVVGLALASKTGQTALSTSQLRKFGPVCASDGRIIGVRRINRAGASVFRVHCSGGLVTDVGR